MRLIHTLLFFFRENRLIEDTHLATECLKSLEKSTYKRVIVYNQGYLTNNTLKEFLKQFNLEFIVIGNSVNVGTAIGRQKCFEYIWDNFPDTKYISELHLDMVFTHNWEDTLIEYLKGSKEPMISCGIINQKGERPFLDENAIAIPNDINSFDSFLSKLKCNKIIPGFTNPCIHVSKILKTTGGYNYHFLKGKQCFEDDSMLLGYYYYYGTKRNWKPKVNYNSVVYHAVAGQRLELTDSILVNYNGLIKQYGAMGLKHLSELHTSPWHRRYFREQFGELEDKVKGGEKMSKKKKKVCVYTIAKNEEKFVDRWYNSVKEADMIIVGDTGSTDSTIEKLKALGVEVHSIDITPWRFDKARNTVMDFIPDDVDICVSIDLDEVFEAGWRDNVEKAWKENTTRLKYNYNWSFDEYGKPATSFLREQIHQRKGYRWVHPVHEVLEYNGDKNEQMEFALNVVLNHYPDSAKSRGQYLSLLEVSVEEKPEDDRNMHYLGREYMYYGMYDKSIETLKKHIDLKSATWKDERCASMRFIARCYKQKEDFNSTREWLLKAIKEAPYTREPYVEMALLEYEEKNWEACYNMCLEALKIQNKNAGYINEDFCWNATIDDLCSISNYYLGSLDKALEYSEEAIKKEPDNQRLRDNNKFFRDEIDKKKTSA